MSAFPINSRGEIKLISTSCFQFAQMLLGRNKAFRKTNYILHYILCKVLNFLYCYFFFYFIQGILLFLSCENELPSSQCDWSGRRAGVVSALHPPLSLVPLPFLFNSPLGTNPYNKTTKAIYCRQPALISGQKLNFERTVPLILPPSAQFPCRADVSQVSRLSNDSLEREFLRPSG